ncbi:MAG TPA: hypothetical protein VHB68_15755 [Steroidobacteraceae bacterium]|nr:hypothetical protein [Steroidobacteraceae bacterium]
MVNGMLAGGVDRQDERQAVPYQEPLRTWAGRGTGALCSLCGTSIKPQDIEYEVELTAPAGTARGLHFHFNCYRVWEAQT